MIEWITTITTTTTTRKKTIIIMDMDWLAMKFIRKKIINFFLFHYSILINEIKNNKAKQTNPNWKNGGFYDFFGNKKNVPESEFLKKQLKPIWFEILNSNQNQKKRSISFDDRLTIIIINNNNNKKNCTSTI